MPAPRPTRRLLAILAAAAVAALPLGLAPEPISSPSAEAATSLAGSKPNIVLVLTDDQTVESASKMPYLQQGLAAGKYVRFVNAEVNNSICCPSRAGLLTGQVDTRNGVVNNTTGRTQFKATPTMASTLKGAGYRTALFGKLINGYAPSWGGFPGWDTFEPLVQGVYKQFNYTLLQDGVEVPYGSAPEDYAVDVLARRASNFIASTPPSQPLFVYLAPTSTHVPWTPAPRHIGRFVGTPMPTNPSVNEADVSDKPKWVRARPLLDMNVQNNVRRKQWTAALAVDDMLRTIDSALVRAGRAENTVVVFISDNGLALGAHRWSRKRCEYLVCSEMLTYVKYPGMGGRTDKRLVTNLDFASTFAALAGTTMPIKQDGVNLVPVLEDPSGTVAGRKGILLHWPGGNDNQVAGTTDDPTPGFYGIRTPRYRYIELFTGEKELYDLSTDPFEVTNLAGRASHSTIQASLKTQLQRLKEASLG